MSAGTGADAREFAAKIRARRRAVGYWMTLDAPPAAERIGRLGYDYVCFDAQHGMLGYEGILTGLTAVQAGGASVGLVRVGANEPYHIGRALDAGAAGVIVPLVNDADEAAAAVRATQYPPHGVRSYGPMRSGLRIGPKPADSNDTVVCLAMIETAQGLANVEEICRVPGLTGVYIGPSDLTIAIGGAYPGDPEVAGAFDAALRRVADAAAAAGVVAGIHTASGEQAAERFTRGFTLATVSSDVVHLENAAAAHLAEARRP